MSVGLKLIRKAAAYQAEDDSLWCEAESVVIAYYQQALRDLHRVIEDFDKEALARIKDCAECASGKDLE